MNLVWADLALLAHLVGFALVMGGLLAQWRAATYEVTAAIVVGSVLSFVTGAVLALVVNPGTGEPPSMVKVGIKATLSLLLMGLAWANYRWETIPRGVWAILLALAAASAGLGVLWH